MNKVLLSFMVGVRHFYVYAAAFIITMRGIKLENYVLEYFTITKYKIIY